MERGTWFLLNITLFWRPEYSVSKRTSGLHFPRAIIGDDKSLPPISLVNSTTLALYPNSHFKHPNPVLPWCSAPISQLEEEASFTVFIFWFCKTHLSTVKANPPVPAPLIKSKVYFISAEEVKLTILTWVEGQATQATVSKSTCLYTEHPSTWEKVPAEVNCMLISNMVATWSGFVEQVVLLLDKTLPVAHTEQVPSEEL